jgi:Fe-S-cluster containining protein
MKNSKVNYDCAKCPGYCCSYPRIEVTKKDIERLAEHFKITATQAKSQFTQRYEFMGERPEDHVKEQILRHKKDHIYKSTCQFLDQDKRRCSIYEARPSVCRQFPDGKKCGYYGFLKFERKAQGDPDFIPTA